MNIPKPNTIPESTSAIDIQTNSQPSTHCSQIIPFYDTTFFKYKNHFQGFFLPDDYSLDLKTFRQQHSQDPVLGTLYFWLTQNEKPDFLRPLITDDAFLHAYYKRFSQLFLMILQSLLAYTQKPPFILQHTLLHFQVQDTALFEFVSLFECFKPFLTS